MTTSPWAPGKGRPRPTSAAPLAPGGSAAWMDRAACASADPEIFFPATGESDATAMQYCANCPVRDVA